MPTSIIAQVSGSGTAATVTPNVLTERAPSAPGSPKTVAVYDPIAVGVKVVVPGASSVAAVAPPVLEMRTERKSKFARKALSNKDTLCWVSESMLKERTNRPAKSQLTEEYLKERGF